VLQETDDLARSKGQPVVSKPAKHGDKWRIRWLNEHGKRQSDVFDDYKVAQTDLRRHQVEVEEIQRGVRNPRVQKIRGALVELLQAAAPDLACARFL
jgi:hypothetical protein